MVVLPRQFYKSFGVNYTDEAPSATADTHMSASPLQAQEASRLHNPRNRANNRGRLQKLLDKTSGAGHRSMYRVDRSAGRKRKGRRPFLERRVLERHLKKGFAQFEVCHSQASGSDLLIRVLRREG
jgi:hypothetical protein